DQITEIARMEFRHVAFAHIPHKGTRCSSWVFAHHVRTSPHKGVFELHSRKCTQNCFDIDLLYLCEIRSDYIRSSSLANQSDLRPLELADYGSVHGDSVPDNRRPILRIAVFREQVLGCLRSLDLERKIPLEFFG